MEDSITHLVLDKLDFPLSPGRVRGHPLHHGRPVPHWRVALLEKAVVVIIIAMHRRGQSERYNEKVWISSKNNNKICKTGNLWTVYREQNVKPINDFYCIVWQNLTQDIFDEEYIPRLRRCDGSEIERRALRRFPHVKFNHHQEMYRYLRLKVLTASLFFQWTWWWRSTNSLHSFNSCPPRWMLK